MFKRKSVVVGTSVSVVLVSMCVFYAGTRLGDVNVASMQGNAAGYKASKATTTKLVEKAANGQQAVAVSNTVKATGVAQNAQVAPTSASAKERDGILNVNRVNLREEPDTDSLVLTKLAKGDKVSITGQSGVWFSVRTESGAKGWVASVYVSDDLQQPATTLKVMRPTKAVITVARVNLRSGSDLTSDVLSKLKRGQKVTIVGHAGDWDHVKTPNGTNGWVLKLYVSRDLNAVTRSGSKSNRNVYPHVYTKPAAPKSPAQPDDENTMDGDTDSIVETAMQYLGTPYRYGGSSPEGFDCSGLTKYVYAKNGVDIARVVAEQVGNGKSVSRSELKSGDLVFFNTDGARNYINHVGIYVGGGNFVHAASGNRKLVVVSSLNQSFYNSAYMGARRIVN